MMSKNMERPIRHINRRKARLPSPLSLTINTNDDPSEYRITRRKKMIAALINMPEFQCGKV